MVLVGVMEAVAAAAGVDADAELAVLDETANALPMSRVIGEPAAAHWLS